MHRYIFPVLLATLCLGGCDKPDPPLPDDIYKDVPISSRKIGQPFELQDCRVQAYRVIMKGPFPDASVFVADCPTARVVSALQAGKVEIQSAAISPKTGGK